MAGRPGTGRQVMQAGRASSVATGGLVPALDECQAAARRGFSIASDSLKESSQAIREVSKSLSGCLKRINKSRVHTPGVVEQLRDQLSNAMRELEQLRRTTESDLRDRRERLDRFSVTLFGRTMSGKSTLMEILTQGDGQSIGTGAQRATRDVRSYAWNGLEVTDVPGVAAFEGAEDEEIAFQAAAQADLVLFLITDDAPQPAEAECLARVRLLGKPVLGICNVKVAIDDPEDLSLFLRSSDRSFDRNRLVPLLRQFNAFADHYTPGRHVFFIFTHLRSRFLADRPGFTGYRDRLLRASRFRALESRIIQEITGRGAFLRIKSFIDGIAAPMMELTDALLDFSARNSASGRVLIGKSRQLQTWAEQFLTEGRERIDSLVDCERGALREEIPAFAEDHYDDPKAGEAWGELVESRDIQKKAQKLQQDLHTECKEVLSEIARELDSELVFVEGFASDRRIPTESVLDTKRAWTWGITSIAGGLGIAAIVFASGPLGWAAAAVGVVGYLLSFLFDDREVKARRARRKLSQRLSSNIEKTGDRLREKMYGWFQQDLLAKQGQVLLGDLKAVTSGVFELADAQRQLAWALTERGKLANALLVDEAISHLGAESAVPNVQDIARIPGLATMFLIDPGITFPEDIRASLERLLGEKVWFVVNTGNRLSILAQAIGQDCDRQRISIEERIRVAHVALDDVGPVARARVRLAQQLTGLHVMR